MAESLQLTLPELILSISSLALLMVAYLGLVVAGRRPAGVSVLMLAGGSLVAAVLAHETVTIVLREAFRANV